MHSRPTPGIPTAALGHVKNALKRSTIAREDPGLAYDRTWARRETLLNMSTKDFRMSKSANLTE